MFGGDSQRPTTMCLYSGLVVSILLEGQLYNTFCELLCLFHDPAASWSPRF